MDYNEYIGNPRRTMLLAYKNGHCLGYIRLRHNWNGFCFIEDFLVGSDCRGRGVGSRLLAAAEIWAIDRGLKGFMLEAQDFNLAACRLYRRRGFVIGGVDIMLYHNTVGRGDLALFLYKFF